MRRKLVAFTMAVILVASCEMARKINRCHNFSESDDDWLIDFMDQCQLIRWIAKWGRLQFDHGLAHGFTDEEIGFGVLMVEVGANAGGNFG